MRPFLLPGKPGDAPSAQPSDSSRVRYQPEANVIPPSLITQTRKDSVVTQLPSAVASNVSVPKMSLMSCPTTSALFVT